MICFPSATAILLARVSLTVRRIALYSGNAQIRYKNGQVLGPSLQGVLVSAPILGCLRPRTPAYAKD